MSMVAELNAQDAKETFCSLLTNVHANASVYEGKGV